MEIKVFKVNAFTDSIDGGNPAGVVLDSPDLTDEQMKQITKELVVSETAFVKPGINNDYRVRFFSPTVEVELCGHATIATFCTMALKGMFSQSIVVTQETKAGILPVDVNFDNDDNFDRVMMTQSKPVLKNIDLDLIEIANALKVSVEEINTSLPRQIVSTGLFTLPVCIKSYNILSNINPDFKKIRQICKKYNLGSFHLFTFDTVEPNSAYHARNFAPIYGINEDPVTGTANGAVSSYLIKNNIIQEKSLICEQGDIIGRSGRVFVEYNKDLVKVGGRAVIVEEKTIKL